MSTAVSGDTSKLSRAERERERERERIKKGELNKIGRLVLFSPIIPSGETSNWSVVNVNDVKVPDYVKSFRKMTTEEREHEEMLEYTKRVSPPWPSCIFARVDAKMSQKDTEDNLDNVKRYWELQLTAFGNDIKVAYSAAVVAYPDVMFHK